MFSLIQHIILGLILLLSNPDARKGNAAYESGNYAEAEQLFTAALEAEPENAKLWFNLGNALAKQGKTEEAIDAYMEYRSRTQQPEEKAMAEYNIGTILAESENWDPAALHFRNALQLNPSDRDARINYELALKKQQEQEEEDQQQQDQQNEDIEPSEYAKAMKKQAEALVEQKKYQDAYNLMMRALQVDETVNAFKDFIQRTKDVADINS